MSDNPQTLDDLLSEWPFTTGQVLVRRISADDGRDLVQMRVDLGVLQLEASGRPDGEKPGGFDTYYDYLVATAFEQGPDFQFTEEQCAQVDREFYQYYHRRICWLALKEYALAVSDAEHTLALMDFTSANTSDEEWAMMHEQYRPFVLFHKIQATALVALEVTEPDQAVKTLDSGLTEIERLFVEHDAQEHFEDDPFVVKLREMRSAVVEHFHLGPPLADQLAEAIAEEHYELAAQIRDRIAHRHRDKRS